MTDNTNQLVDAGLAALAQDMQGAAPRPGPDLIARVLADAAAVSAERAPAPEATSQTTQSTPGLMNLMFGWTTGAIATMTLCLSIGFAVGMEMDNDIMTFDEDAMETEMADGADAMFMPEEFF